MFDSLFKVNINWLLFFIVILLTRIVFPEISWLSYLALVITFHQFFLIFYSINHIIPIRYLFGTLMCLQIFVGPVLAYNGLDNFQPDIYRMKVSEEIYFSYALPAVISFILGLHFRSKNLRGEVIDLKALNSFANSYPNMAYYFIAIGFASSFLSEIFFASNDGLRFLFYLLSNVKFVGAFILILGNKQLKIIPLILIYGSVISSSLVGGLFHDLIIWLIILGTVIAIRYKPSNLLKIVFLVCFILITIVIQQLKGGYRTAISGNRQGGLETLTETYEKSEEQNQIFNLAALAKSSVRINQGFIITNIMRKVPREVPFSGGEQLNQILEAAFLPRVLAPNKLNAGDQTIFIKYTGIQLGRGTTMALSSIGDAYINFGIYGGCLFMLVLGLLYNQILKLFHKFSLVYPLLILFTTVVFYFPIRPDSELQTNLGHLVKACFTVYLLFALWSHTFSVKQRFINTGR